MELRTGNAIVAYELDWKGGDPCHYTLDMWNAEADIYKASARTWALYTEPQQGCSAEVAVYRGKHFVDVTAIGPDRDMTGLVALYRGPMLNDPWVDAEVSRIFQGHTPSQ